MDDDYNEQEEYDDSYGYSAFEGFDLTWIGDLLNSIWFWVFIACAVAFWFWQKHQKEKAAEAQAEKERVAAADEAVRLKDVAAALADQLVDQRNHSRQRGRALITEYLLSEVEAKLAVAEAKSRPAGSRGADRGSRGRPQIDYGNDAGGGG